MNSITNELNQQIKERTGIDLGKSTIPDIQTLKEKIIAFAETGGDFGCKCYYCESTPIDLVNRGDAIPFMYEMGKTICFRCTDGGFYADVKHVEDISKKIELLKAYAHEPACRDIQIKKLSEELKGD